MSEGLAPLPSHFLMAGAFGLGAFGLVSFFRGSYQLRVEKEGVRLASQCACTPQTGTAGCLLSCRPPLCQGDGECTGVHWAAQDSSSSSSWVVMRETAGSSLTAYAHGAQCMAVSPAELLCSSGRLISIVG